MIRRLFSIFLIMCIAQLLFPPRVAANVSHPIFKPSTPPTPENLPPLYGTDIRFERLTNEQGLSMSVVNSIAQDRQGFVWFATQDGLNRYDGKNFRIYKHDPDNSTSLAANWIEALLVNSQGALWIGTMSNGLDCFDEQTGEFIHYRHQSDNPASLINNQITSIYEDRSGILWLTTAGGVDRFDRKTGRFSHLKDDPSIPDEILALEVKTVYQDLAGQFWFSSKQGLARFDPSSSNFTIFTHKPNDPSSLSENNISAVLQDRSGNLWVATFGGGLNLLNKEGQGFVHFDFGEEVADNPDQVYLTTLFEDPAGRIWMGAWGGGLIGFDPVNGQSIAFRYEPENPASLGNDNIKTIFSDISGSVWIGTFGGGLSKFDYLSQQFLHYRSNPRDTNSLSSNMVWSIIANNQELWIGTNNGLDRLDLQTGQYTHFRNNPVDKQGLQSNIIQALYRNSTGGIWIGTYMGGLSYYEPKYNRFRTYRNDPLDPDSLSNDTVNAIAQDSSGDLWIGTKNGLNRFDRNTQKFKVYVQDPKDPTTLSSSYINVISPARNSKLWVGTPNGFNSFDPIAGKSEHYNTVPVQAGDVSSDRIISIMEDQSGIVWLGSVGNGLIRFNPLSKEMKAFHEKDGLPNDTVYGILADKDHNLWLSTNNGLSRLDPVSMNFKTYYSRDGIQSNEFNSYAYFKSSTGELYFGGINGVTAFYPGSIQENSYVPPVMLTALSQNGKSVQSGTPVEQIKTITVNYPDNSLEFEFAALSYIQSDRNQFAYMLENFDRDWNMAGTNGIGRYTNLPGGDYSLRLTASNNAGLWNESGISIPVRVVPPFWQTAWFRAGLVLMALLFIYSGYMLRVRSVISHNRQLENQVVERTREIDQRRQELEDLYSADEVLYRNLNLDQVLQALVDSAVNLLHADKGNLLVWDKQKSRLVPKASRGFDQELIHQLAIAAGEGVAGQVFVTGEPALVADTEKDPRVPRQIIDSEGIQSFIQVPIKVSGEIFGVFSADYISPHDFSENELRSLTSLAQRAALAIQNAQIYEQTQAQAVEEERGRLARELHDAVTQTLFSASLIAEALPASWESNPGEGRQLLAELRQLSRGALAEMRTLLMELRPSALEEAHLEDLLRQLGEAASGREGIPISIVTDGRCPLPPDVHIAFYRIAQEALNNALKHARASQVNIQLRKLAPASSTNGDLRQGAILTVQDNGRGFQIDQVPSSHLGLNIMRERAQAIGATLTVESQPGQGTQITVLWDGNHL